MILTLSIDGHQIVAKRLNPGTTLGNPIVLLHGIGGSVDFWAMIKYKAFKNRVPVMP